MGLRGALTRRAVTGAHVLLVESPGSWRTRVQAEQALVRRGWREAAAPADADVLLVCGHAGPRLSEAVDAVWEQLPGPRVRVAVHGVESVEDALDQAAAGLLDDRGQRRDAAERAIAPAMDESDGEHTDHEGMDHHSGMDHEGMDHGGMDHGGMDHGDMDMSGPGGIALAGGGPDRDGLAMDVLHLPLGPVLPHWPAGLVLRCALQGDVVTESEVEVLDAEEVSADDAHWSPSDHAARWCDSAADVLALVGWAAMAAAVRRTRDLLLADTEPAECARTLERLHARVARSRSLRWALRDLGRLDDADVAEQHLPHDVRGDVHDRLLRQLTSAGDLLRPSADAGRQAAGPERVALIAAIPTLVRGLDLAAVRLVVASLAPLPVGSAVVAPRGGGHA